MKINKRLPYICLAIALMMSLFSACGAAKSKTTEAGASSDIDTEVSITDLETSGIPLAEGVPAAQMATAVASGVSVENNGKVTMDYSNTADGYIMIKYSGSNQKVKTQITGPSGVTYTYNQSLTGDYDVYSLSDGSGKYAVRLYENTSGSSYSTAFSFTIDVALKDEFAPFLRSNKYVSYTATSKIVAKAAELCKDKKTTNEKINAVYEFVVNSFSYDYQRAKTVQSGYIPNLDDVLAKKSGICFDYAASMTAMLRSQGVPTKMIFGYTGTAYHAWISTYSKESGWVTAAIYFDGKAWKLMDPTFASTAKSSAEIMKYIGNGANYVAKYLY